MCIRCNVLCDICGTGRVCSTKLQATYADIFKHVLWVLFVEKKNIKKQKTNQNKFPLSYGRLSEWLLRTWRELWLLSSRATVLTGSDPSGPPLRPIIRTHWHPFRGHGPSHPWASSIQWSTALFRHHVSPPRRVAQPGTRDPRTSAQYVVRRVRPQSLVYLTVPQRKRIQQPPLPSSFRNERGYGLVAPEGIAPEKKIRDKRKERMATGTLVTFLPFIFIIFDMFSSLFCW